MRYEPPAINFHLGERRAQEPSGRGNAVRRPQIILSCREILAVPLTPPSPRGGEGWGEGAPASQLIFFFSSLSALPEKILRRSSAESSSARSASMAGLIG